MSEEPKQLVKKNTSSLRSDEIMMLAYYLEYAATYIKENSQLAAITKETPIKDYKKN
jgi:uncharacterized protein (UPF0305 family)